MPSPFGVHPSGCQSPFAVQPFRVSGTFFASSPFDISPILDEGNVVKANRIRLFVKPYCGWCHKAMHWLDDRGIAYQEIDVTADEVAFDEMIRLSGQELAPVIDVNGKILADFGPEQLADFWEKLEKPNK